MRSMPSGSEEGSRNGETDPAFVFEGGRRGHGGGGRRRSPGPGGGSRRCRRGAGGRALGATPAEMVVAYIRDEKRGEVTVLWGENEQTYRDRALARRLKRAARHVGAR